MKISSIFIENYKAISKIDISNLPNFVVIVGENGVGKSSIFDAIAFAKTMLSPYGRQDTEYWQNRMKTRNPIKIGKNEMKIVLEIEPTTDMEKKLTNNNTATVKIAFKKNENGNISMSNDATNNAVELLRSWGKQKGVGGLEYIPATRVYREGKLTLQSSPINTEQFLSQRVSQLENKYQDVKQKFVNFITHDAIRPQDPPMFPEAQALVKSLLEKNIHVDFDNNMVPEILIDTEDGSVDIDSLSDGQRELFITYIGIHSTKLSNSIILFDEPDLHLHASMQKKALEHLIKFSEAGNQIFLTTHSLDMITETPEKNIYHMSSDYSGESQLKNLEDEKDKVLIYQKLGASKYTFVNFKKVIFVEGESDYKILHNASTNKQNIRFHQIGGVTKISPDLLTEASHIESFFMIRDKDFVSIEEIASEELNYRNKVKFLRRRVIENYILDSTELFDVYMKHGDKKIKTYEDMLIQLKSIADNHFEQTISDYYVAMNTKDMNFDHIRIKSDETAENSIADVLKLKKERMQTSIDKAPELVKKYREKLKEHWNDEWIIYCNGKLVLQDFANMYFEPSRKMQEIRDLVSGKWDDKQKLPSDIQKLIDDISIA